MADAVDDGEAARLERLDRGLERVRIDPAGWRAERLLVMASGALVALGVLLILLGWHGASRTPNLYEQLPYVISGGQLGGTLALLGALLYFGRWLAALVREQRAQGLAIVQAIARLEARLADGEGGGPAPVALVATVRGSLAHRPDCSAVAGKPGLRPVTAADGLAPCRLCLG